MIIHKQNQKTKQVRSTRETMHNTATASISYKCPYLGLGDMIGWQGLWHRLKCGPHAGRHGGTLVRAEDGTGVWRGGLICARVTVGSNSLGYHSVAMTLAHTTISMVWLTQLPLDHP